MSRRRAHPPRVLRRMLRRIFPGARGTEVLEDLDREYSAFRRRHPGLFADGWYLAQLFRPGTWTLARALRRIAEAERGDRRDRVGRARDRSPSGGLALDLRLAWRMLAKSPGLTVVGVLGIALGIGVGVGFFVTLTNVVSPELPLDGGERVVVLRTWDVQTQEPVPSSMDDYLSWRDGLRAVDEIGAFRVGGVELVTGTGAAGRAEAARMTSEAFDLARVAPLLGRRILPEDEAPGAPRVVVLGHDLWLARFEGDREVLGRSVLVADAEHTVVGVMPPGFAFPERQELWTALRTSPLEEGRASPAVVVAGRLAEGASPEQAAVELTDLVRAGVDGSTGSPDRLQAQVLRYTHALDNLENVTLWEVAQVQLVVMLLLIAIAANVAVLMYARTATRQAEIAVRTALGASRHRIVAQLALEALLLSGLGALVGLAGAHLALERAEVWLEGLGWLSFWNDYGLRPVTVAYALLLALVVTAVVGVAPALKATGRELDAHMRRIGGGATAQLGWVWTTLIVMQVAIVVAVLPTAVSVGYRQISMVAVQPTYAAHELVWAEVGLALPVPPGADATTYRRNVTARFAERLPELERRIESEPAVIGVTIEARLPGWGPLFEVEGAPGPADGGAHRAISTGVTPDYFEVLEIPVLAGRGLRMPTTGVDDGARGVVVSEGFARVAVGDVAAVGRRVRLVTPPESGRGSEPAGPWLEIVGVVADLEASVLDPQWARPMVFYPVAPGELQSAELLIRVRGTDTESFAPNLRRIVADLDPDLRVGSIANLASEKGNRIHTTMVSVLLLATASVLLLSAAGIHALTSLAVTRRRKEIGIRTALGVAPARLLASIFSRAARQLGAGALLGALVGGALLVGSGRGRSELVVFLGGVVLLMLAAGLLAAVEPARRGLGIQPAEALKEE